MIREVWHFYTYISNASFTQHFASMRCDINVKYQIVFTLTHLQSENDLYFKRKKFGCRRWGQDILKFEKCVHFSTFYFRFVITIIIINITLLLPISRTKFLFPIHLQVYTESLIMKCQKNGLSSNQTSQLQWLLNFSHHELLYNQIHMTDWPLVIAF